MLDDAAPTGSGRPRDTRIDDAVLAATRDLVAEVGYADLTFRAIAERAGTSVPAIRRRWASKAHLVHEAVFPVDVAAGPAVDGTLRGVLRTIVTRCVAVVGSPAGRRATPALISELMTDSALEKELSARLRSRVWDDLADSFAGAVARGEARGDLDISLCVEAVFGTTLVAVVLRGAEAVDETWIEQFVDMLADGLASHR
ncbi:TetR/AcrR family transcriptional regulator [Nocardia farcinica]|uniref:Putative transcriptional regulator n=1 Tax=Nocardia farcinica (strain IFM 10152) TaxID=247156 RepID=Q5YUJ6_NOCFA|nr:TetR/AcrR family transcriptional regulator [Nocardia farcinica]MBF6232783.1 TetR/AcrR family transcriptional regulator [Nocardia farcinica]MBF6257277.1 TetR/AcrR family transcriptional regulator [Nocardia farcinica]MBF6573496.1 TetR/AcrR family transcriptional regulator [Nocardia farcinica]SUE27994.1 tetr family transcriptional regulator [Nocardia farcinica]BAD58145.1 putative transcriptional regulator [Nocardia farcinica IFM 10152]